MAEAAARRSASQDGPTYTQVLVGPDGPRVGELAARLGGGHDAELCDAALGVDLNRLAIAAALGERIDEGGLVPDELAGGACVRFLVPEPGVLEAVEGLEAAERSSGVVWVRSYREPGHEFGAAPPRRRPGRRRARRRRLAQAGRRRARRAAERIRFLTAMPKLSSDRRGRQLGPSGQRLTAGIERERGRTAAASICCVESDPELRRTPYACAVLRSRRTTLLSFQPPAIGDEEIEAVTETLRSGWLTTGPRTAELERRFADYVEAKHALAVTSGTAALHLALVALGVGPGDEVITTPITWPATANVIVHTGATPGLRRRPRERPEHRPGRGRARSSRRGRRRSCPCTSPASRPTSTRSGRSACRSSRTPRTRSRAPTAAARSAASRRPPASRSTRRRTSPPARAG